MRCASTWPTASVAPASCPSASLPCGARYRQRIRYMVRVRFFDDEMLEGNAQDLDLDEPDFILEIDDPSGLENSEVAWIPLSAVKMVELPMDKQLEAKGRKVAIRFLDGEGLRGHAAGEIKRHRYGLSIHLHPETSG